jgi:hypothetical protein
MAVRRLTADVETDLRALQASSRMSNDSTLAELAARVHENIQPHFGRVSEADDKPPSTKSWTSHTRWPVTLA